MIRSRAVKAKSPASKSAPTKNESQAAIINLPFNLISGLSDLNDSRPKEIPVGIAINKTTNI